MRFSFVVALFCCQSVRSDLQIWTISDIIFCFCLFCVQVYETNLQLDRIVTKPYLCLDQHISAPSLLYLAHQLYCHWRLSCQVKKQAQVEISNRCMLTLQQCAVKAIDRHAGCTGLLHAAVSQTQPPPSARRSSITSFPYPDPSGPKRKPDQNGCEGPELALRPASQHSLSIRHLGVGGRKVLVSSLLLCPCSFSPLVINYEMWCHCSQISVNYATHICVD